MKIFIGSSSKAIEKAEAIQATLETMTLNEPIDVVPWTAFDTIRVSYPTFEELLRNTKKCHGGVFIFDKDEIVVRKDRNGKENHFYFPNHNVVLEAGLFAGALGQHNIVIFMENDVERLSDFEGVTYIPFDSKNTKITATQKQKLKEWIENISGNRPPCSRNNLLMLDRKQIHSLYPLESRLGFDRLADDQKTLYKHISNVRVMNLAGNLLITPELTESTHQAQSKVLTAIPSTEVLEYIISDSPAVVQILLTNPEICNMKDAIARMPNITTPNRSDYIFQSWIKIAKNVCGDTVFAKAYTDGRLAYYAFDGVLPYAVFQVEFETEYEQYNHIKIDLYSSDIGEEDDRRSFVIWQATDSENYKFFSTNINYVMRDEKISKRIDMDQMIDWKNGRKQS